MSRTDPVPRFEFESIHLESGQGRRRTHYPCSEHAVTLDWRIRNGLQFSTHSRQGQGRSPRKGAHHSCIIPTVHVYGTQHTMGGHGGSHSKSTYPPEPFPLHLFLQSFEILVAVDPFHL